MHTVICHIILKLLISAWKYKHRPYCLDMFSAFHRYNCQYNPCEFMGDRSLLVVVVVVVAAVVVSRKLRWYLLF